MARRDDDDRLGTARDEAERLIAAALAAASFASRQAARRSRERERGRRDDSLGDDLAGLAGAATRLVGGWLGGSDRDRRGNDRYAERYDGYGRRNDAWDADRDRAGNGDRRTASTHHIANGSDACCSCPVCRAIDFVREPSPEFVERVATGASDLASGVTSMLRAFSDVTGVGRGPRQRPGRADVIDDYPPRYPTEPTMAEPEPIGEPGVRTRPPMCPVPANRPTPSTADHRAEPAVRWWSRRGLLERVAGGHPCADDGSAATRTAHAEADGEESGQGAHRRASPNRRRRRARPAHRRAPTRRDRRPRNARRRRRRPSPRRRRPAPRRRPPRRQRSAKASSRRRRPRRRPTATKTAATATKATPRRRPPPRRPARRRPVPRRPARRRLVPRRGEGATKATGAKATGSKATGTKATGAKATGSKATPGERGDPEGGVDTANDPATARLTARGIDHDRSARLASAGFSASFRSSWRHPPSTRRTRGEAPPPATANG